MSAPAAASDVLNREFLEVRARILEVAAALDRIDRAAGSVMADERWERIQRGLSVLAESQAGRAERVQIIFSLPYEQAWQNDFQIGRRGSR
jgi:hypothetical protein